MYTSKRQFLIETAAVLATPVLQSLIDDNGPLTKWYNEGRMALQGIDCPYQQDTAEYVCWWQGYDDSIDDCSRLKGGAKSERRCLSLKSS